MEKNTQTVRVVDEHGTEIGYTYPKRAKGLVKKCRAEFVTDHEIRLYKQAPTYENKEDDEMDGLKRINYLTINTGDWYPDMNDPNTKDNSWNNNYFKTGGTWDRFMISNPFEEAMPSAPGMVEILSVGTFDWNQLTRVAYGPFQLEADTEYHLVFWLNGGENDRSDETCNLEIFNLTSDGKKYTNRICCCLNRKNIQPRKKYKGWEYYVIPFCTDSLGYVKLRFVADRAPMAIMAADVPEAYEDMPDVPDPFEGIRPQRHNIYFEDGWPQDTWYSTEALKAKDMVASASNCSAESEMQGSIKELNNRVDLLTEKITDMSEQFRDLTNRFQELIDLMKQS